MRTLVLVLDLVGTFVFALSGATAGARRRLDIFGVLVYAIVLLAGLLPELAEPRVLRTLGSPLDDTVACERPITARHLLTGTAGHGFCTWESAVTPLLMEQLHQAADDIHEVPAPDEWSDPPAARQGHEVAGPAQGGGPWWMAARPSFAGRASACGSAWPAWRRSEAPGSP